MKHMPLILCAALLATGCQTATGTRATVAGAGSESGRAVAPPPANPSSLDIGVRLLAANQPAMALDAFNRSVTQDGISAEALTGIGVSYLRLGQRSQAKQFLKAAIEVDPNSALARNNLGVALYDEGDYVSALSEFNRAYALTDGLDASVATNVGIAELAVATEAEAGATLDVAEFDVIQYGHGVYRLEPRQDAPPVTVAERTQ